VSTIGFWFDGSGNIKAIQIIGESNHTYSDVFSETNTFYLELLSYYDARGDRTGSTNDLGEGWASTELTFYALQEAIVAGAYSSALYSTLFAFLVLIVLTKRILSSIFAAFQITCVVVAVVGVFVMLGWELNVVESIILAVSVGLACDFSAHLAHSFNDNEPKPLEGLTPYNFPTSIAEFTQQYLLATQKATGAVTNLGVTILMGFASTFCTGIVLTSGALYFFQQFGIFLMTLMAFSIVFAFCMLMPILASIGWVDRILAYVGDNSIVKPIMVMMGISYAQVNTMKVDDVGSNLKENTQVDATVADSVEGTVTVDGATAEEVAML
jgi:protein dispatched 1